MNLSRLFNKLKKREAKLVAGCIVGLLFSGAQRAMAVECSVTRHGPPSEADKAYLAANYGKAESLYRAAIATAPDNREFITGLVLTLLSEQKVQEAFDTVQAALVRHPGLPYLISLRGEVELRQGEPWKAVVSANQAAKLDPCNARTHLLLSSLAAISTMDAVSDKEAVTAHILDPQDPDIREAWLMTLPLRERIPQLEAFLSSPNGNDAGGVRELKQSLDWYKAQVTEPQDSCTLVSKTSSASIPMRPIVPDGRNILGFGIDTKLNGHGTRLQIDTGSGGLLISRTMARHAKLKLLSPTDLKGVGDEGIKSAHFAVADSIDIGGLEFHHCTVEVADTPYLNGNIDGLIGMNVFAKFLVTLDYPTLSLQLDPLPPLPNVLKPAAASLNTTGVQRHDIAEQVQSSAVSAGATKQIMYKRYIPPGMEHYTQVYEDGFHLLIPVQLNDSHLRLFLIDTGAWTTIISTQAARQFTRVFSNDNLQVEGLDGKVKTVYAAQNVTFHFAGLNESGEDVVALDMSATSKADGLEVSGMIGAATLHQLTTHIDYRDGLVKFDYDPKRGYRY